MSHQARRPTIQGLRHTISAGQYLAAQAGFQILEAGGNAIDAGVAAGIAMGVVQSEYVNIAGVAPIMIYLANTREVVTISGLGVWPRAASLDKFDGCIPDGVLRTVVPAAPDAWITALERYGSLTFGDVAKEAIRFARDGFVMYPAMSEIIGSCAEDLARWPSNSAIYLPDGRVPKPGELFVQQDLAGTLQYMVDEEASAGTREAGLQAAREAFYRGDIAQRIVSYHENNGGLLTMQDMADFHVGIEPSVSTQVLGATVHTCDTWTQGPVLLQMLKLLEGMHLDRLEHNSPAYVHTLLEAMKLAFADREAYYADPRFHDVPLRILLSDAYNADRRNLIRMDKAISDVSPGNVSGTRGLERGQLDTSYVCAIDAAGNAFSSTPSDVIADTPIIPGTGLAPSSRGSQSWAVPGHPCEIKPGTRPRLTPNPAILLDEKMVMPFGTPGGDVQCQAMLQFLLNHRLFNMPIQEAIEAPRFATFSFPASFEPHEYLANQVNLEARIPQQTGAALANMGHDVQWWDDWTLKAGGVCAASREHHTGLTAAGADPRRACYALGW